MFSFLLIDPSCTKTLEKAVRGLKIVGFKTLKTSKLSGLRTTPAKNVDIKTIVARHRRIQTILSP
jgi:hypothetical protein